MPLAHLTGKTSQNGIFDIGFAFIVIERQGNYRQLLQNLKQLWIKDLKLPALKVIVTDRELSLKNALKLDEFFSDIPQILCQWHIN